MTLSKVAEIYKNARDGGYGVSGFCAENLDMVLAILDAAEETQSPVVVVLWEADIKSVGPGYLEAIIKHGAGKVRVPVGIMLDHGQDLAICLESIIYGHSGVMIDASHEEFEQNISMTRQVCEIAHAVGVLVEGEIGTVRRTFEATGPYAEKTIFTDPVQVPLFVQKTGVDAIAVSVGTESGIPASTPVLDFERLNMIANSTDAYLIIHGGSGITKEALRKAVDCGVTAFRFASELRVAYLDTLVKARNALSHDYPDTRLIFKPAREAAKKLIMERMEQLGCVGKAW